MSYRSAQIYVQPRTAKLLRLVTKLYPERTPAMTYGSEAEKTSDERADQILQRAISEQYPLVVELAKEQEKLEKAFIEKAKQ